ncbi:MAG: type II toxin-antitoxin system PemK/MazF family toxin [Nocardioides sp.]
MRRLLARILPSRAVRDRIYYAPRTDGLPEPGEVCWAWVPYEEDATRGKDRPVLVVGMRGKQWLALMLTSKDHNHNAVRQEHDGIAIDHFGHRWLDIGTGAWDREHRASEIRLDRLLVLDHVRREGSALDRTTFDRVIAAAGLSG